MEKRIKVVSVNISHEKGTRKNPIDFIELTEIGIPEDAHRGKWHRQVSMLGIDSIEAFSRQHHRAIGYGEFAENITVSGMELKQAQVFDTFRNATVELEITQIGKKCHGKNCVIFTEIGDCIMPKEGVFLRVIQGGKLQPGDQLQYFQKIFRIKVITVSDRASAGIYEDRSGPLIAKLCEGFFMKNNRKCSVQREIIPDDPFQIETQVKKAFIDKFDLIFTTGGTGIDPRDVTPEVVRSLLDKEIPGIMELIRMKYGMEKPNVLLSRSVAGVMGTSLVYTLPGSEKAVTEYTEEIFKTVNHSLMMLHGLGDH
jgi:molybdenum cofactor synthesis domain-containing protein